MDIKNIVVNRRIRGFQFSADPKDCFDQTQADAFEAEGKIIIKPGDELLLTVE